MTVLVKFNILLVIFSLIYKYQPFSKLKMKKIKSTKVVNERDKIIFVIKNTELEEGIMLKSGVNFWKVMCLNVSSLY